MDDGKKDFLSSVRRCRSSGSAAAESRKAGGTSLRRAIHFLFVISRLASSHLAIPERDCVVCKALRSCRRACRLPLHDVANPPPEAPAKDAPEGDAEEEDAADPTSAFRAVILITGSVRAASRCAVTSTLYTLLRSSYRGPLPLSAGRHGPRHVRLALLLLQLIGNAG
ncbi:hypothetical protein HPB48_001154 [Haemaphysalis longicornis]|uniref:Uncharacterized protein n=1 Tax=Haemaphysalis longicornis TaxID=44386 RepID=A0A9J6FIA8_HAELO|nr:hypothetical protein HPB48_001154 [Haemaphysalis longicornis]